MKIAILTLGTRGDVQPYAVLGAALSEKGHIVTLSTAKNFEHLVRSFNLQFVAIEADFQELLNSDEGKKMMKANPWAVKRNLHSWVYPLISSSLTTFYQLATENDLVLYHVKTLADSFADQFPHKMIRTSLLPIVEPTSSFANPALSGIPIPRFLNRMSYRLTQLSMRLLAKPIGQFRQQHKLPPLGTIPQVRNIYGISPHFLAKPTDLMPNSLFTGFWFNTSTEDLSPDLLDFIKAGTPPLLVTFGSMPFKSKLNLEQALTLLTKQLNIRLLVVKGWGLHAESFHHPNIKLIDSAPFDKLFPLTKAIVHHGGIGTTAECLRAGKPCFVCPVLYPVGDQQFWGNHIYTQGLGPKPIALSKLTEKSFVTSIEQLLNTPHYYTNAQEFMYQLKLEDGLQNAVNAIINKYHIK